MINPTLIEIVEHESASEAAVLVAEEAAAWLGICCTGGTASVALPGGRSPTAMLKALGAHPIPWRLITVTTTDERKVPLDHSLSNMGRVKKAFEGQFADQATFVPLKDRYAHCFIKLPFDLLVLGIGADGHIASLFPGKFQGCSAELPIIDTVPDPLPIDAPVARRTWSLPALARSRRTLLFCAGPDKRAAIDASLQSTDSPLGAFLARAQGPVTIHWTEKP